MMTLGLVTTAQAASSPSANQQWAVKYVGGTAGPANPKLATLTIGVTNQIGNGGFPQTGPTILAAQNYINKQLGGVNGHPVKLDVCQLQSSQDAQNCGEQFANDPNVKFVVSTPIITDDTAMGSAIGTAGKASLLVAAITSGDYTAPNASSYGPGTPLLLPAMGQYTAKLLGHSAKLVSVIAANNAGGKAAVDAMTGVLTAGGVTNVKYAYVPDAGGTAPQFASAIQASGGAQASVVIELGTDTMCVDSGIALNSLGAHPQAVLTTTGCFDTLVTQHFKGVLPTSWRIFGFGNSPHVPGTSTGVNSYLAAMKQYAHNTDPTTTAALGFATLITSVKIANSVGYDKITPASMIAATRAFTGPAMMEPGPMKCGYITTFPSICGSQVAVDQYTGKKWAESILTVKAS